MADRRRLSIKTSIQTAWAIMLFSVVLAALILHSYFSAKQAKSGREAAAFMLARTLGDQLRLADSVSRQTLQRSCNQLIKEPGIWAVSLRDNNGQQVAMATVDPALENSLRYEQDAGAKARVDLVQLASSLLGQESVRRVQVGLGLPGETGRPAHLTLLLDLDSTPGAGSGSQTLYWASVGLIGATVWLFGVWWVQREYLRPMLALLDPSSRGRANGGRDEITDRNDELGAIARSLEGLQEEITEWRGKAELIERRMDSQIAAETQRISRELRRVQREFWLDPLTRVNNRRFFDEKFASIFSAQRTARHDLSVVMIDLDSFKRINDTLGHVRGDAMLRFAGELLRQCIRRDDFAIRYGGDEFLLVLPGTTAEAAAAMVKRIVAMFAQRAKMIANVQPQPTMSAGIASIEQHLPTAPGDLIEAADLALYQAKRQPGGGVCLADAPRRKARQA